MVTYFEVTGTWPAVQEGWPAPSGAVLFRPTAEITDGADIVARDLVTGTVSGGVLASVDLAYVAGIAYTVVERFAGLPDEKYVITPDGSPVDLGSITRAPARYGTVGPAGPIGATGAAGITPSVTSNTGYATATTVGSVVTLDVPGTATRQVKVLAMTLDPMMAPSQTPPTTARPIFMPLTVEAAGTVGHMWTGYVADAANTAPTLPTNTFVAVYDVMTGVLLGETADLSSQFTAVQNPVSAAFVAPFPVTKGQQILVMLLMNYTGAAASAPQMLAGRLFGTNMSPLTGLNPRAMVNSNGATFTAPPTSVAPAVGGIALAASNSNPAFAIVLST